jgi:hypothetical protein
LQNETNSEKIKIWLERIERAKTQKYKKMIKEKKYEEALVYCNEILKGMLFKSQIFSKWKYFLIESLLLYSEKLKNSSDFDFAIEILINYYVQENNPEIKQKIENKIDEVSDLFFKESDKKEEFIEKCISTFSINGLNNLTRKWVIIAFRRSSI